ncbi:cytochrome P450 [Streptomyces sp. NPDC096339]|uniref:cytochrome P450 n=1 Tax=Streptomyces sp. NPDC096339 TaxID=3366086 RepID=UPI00382F2872
MTSTQPVPQAPGALPLLGHSPALFRAPLAFLSSLPDHGDLVTVRLGPFSMVVLCDPDLTQQVLLDERTFEKGGPMYQRIREAFGNGLVTCPLDQHRRQRQLIQPSFHPARFPGYVDVMVDEITRAADAWHQGQDLDVFTEAKDIVARIAGRTMFSTALPPREFRQALDDLTIVIQGIYRRAMTPPALERLPTLANHRYRTARTRLRETLTTVIRQRRGDATDHGDLLSALLAARCPATDADAGMERLGETEIVDQVITFFAGGTGTTAANISWALHLLAGHPEIEARLYAEADSVFRGRRPTADDLPRLKTANQVVLEALRLYPPGWILTRTTTADTRLGGYTLPAGTTLAYSPYVIHHRADVHPRPEDFDPDRWDGLHSLLPVRRGFIPFGSGARKCIGDTFSVAEATLALAIVTARWHLRPLPGRGVRPGRAAVLNPRGLRLRVSHRH